MDVTNENIKQAINGIYYEYAGKRLQILGDLGLLVKYPVAIGDHAVHSKDIREKLVELEHVNSMLDTINEEFGDVTMPGNEPSAKPPSDEKQECCNDDDCGCD